MAGRAHEADRPTTRRRGERGAVAVEFALVLVPLLVLVFGVIQYGWYFFAAQSTSSGAREAARRLVVGDCQGVVSVDGESMSAAQGFARGQAALETLTLHYGPVGNPSADTLTGMDIGDTLVVTATADANILGLLPLPNGGRVTRVVESRLEDLVGDVGC